MFRPPEMTKSEPVSRQAQDPHATHLGETVRRAASRCATVSDWTGLPDCGVTLRGDRDLAAEQVQSPGIEC